MFSYELELACNAPHRIIFLDGSFTSQLIAFGQAISATEKEEAPIELKNYYLERLEKTFNNYIETLKSSRTDKLHVAVPKYSSRKEVIERLKEEGIEYSILNQMNDKSFLSLVLKAGEVVGPIKLTRKKDRWHLSGKEILKNIYKNMFNKYNNLIEKIIYYLNRLHVLYFKPSSSHPALRVEISEDIARNRTKLSWLLEGLRYQTSPGTLEPYPLYIADTYAKHLKEAIVGLKDITLSEIGINRNFNFSDILLTLHAYRTEGGYE